MAAVPVTYRYAVSSTLDTGDEGQQLGLASTDAGTFLDGFVERADVVATALLRVGEIAATRFYVHPAITAAVTSHLGPRTRGAPRRCRSAEVRASVRSLRRP